ncbi:transglutaminase domain-containing protein [Chitinophaga polysaccharea]|nr:transglutaminase-like domain-containing protein [Chitinophaga polysaccharea]
MNIRYLAVATCIALSTTTYAQVNIKQPVKPAPAAAVTYAPIPEAATNSSAAMGTYLRTHLASQTDMLKAIYGWMASHITYDMVNTFKPDYYKDTADAVQKTLQTRTAVCQGYASLFVDICRHADIPAWLVTGYTITGGKMDNASHAWVAAFTGNKWLLYDPTWGSGYVQNNKYVASLNWKHFGVTPPEYIHTHVPFDPLFQFLDHPLRHDEIRDSKWTAAAGNPVFAYPDTLSAFARMNESQRAQNAIDRMEHYGITNQMISVELTNLKNLVAYTKQNEHVATYNLQVSVVNRASSQYNDLTNSFNEYVVFKNQQFTPNKPDQEIRDWVDGMAKKLEDIDKLLKSVTSNEAPIRNNIAEISTAVAGMRQRITAEQDFVTKYIKTGKLFRKRLFYKLSWK